ncbi:hypothetical protein NHQ30_001203 [Ciborinia camelliae]|nr:hypothetical protein NHQ30_001203 [Ciborinia camelliae]
MPGRRFIHYCESIIGEDAVHAALDGAKDLIPSRLRRSKHLRRFKGSRSISGGEIKAHYSSKEESFESMIFEDPVDDQKMPHVSTAEDSDEKPIICYLQKEISGADCDFEPLDILENVEEYVPPVKAKHVSWHKALTGEDSDDELVPFPRKSVSVETVIRNSLEGEYSDSIKTEESDNGAIFEKETIFEDPVYHQDNVSIFENEDGAISQNSASNTETVVHNPWKWRSKSYFEDPEDYEEEQESETKPAIQRKLSTRELVEKARERRHGPRTHFKPIVDAAPGTLAELFSENYFSKQRLDRQEKIDMLQKKTVGISPRSAPETCEMGGWVYNPWHWRAPSISKDAVHPQETVGSQKENIDTSQKSVSETETVIHIPSKGKSLESVTSEDPINNIIYQERELTHSLYSASVYSQDGIDEIVMTLKTKEINRLKAKLYSKTLEVEELQREKSETSELLKLQREESEASELLKLQREKKETSELLEKLQRENTETSELLRRLLKGSAPNSISETETIIHSLSKGESSGSDEPKVANLSRRQRCRNKLRQYLSSTQEFIAPLLALHPNNRAEKGHTIQRASEASETADVNMDYLGVTGVNPRTGVMDSSEEHVTPPRQVRWAPTVKGWESGPADQALECSSERGFLGIN